MISSGRLLLLATLLSIICGAGTLPFAVAESITSRRRPVVLFAIRGWADPERVRAYRHYWAALGQFGRFCRAYPVQSVHALLTPGFQTDYSCAGIMIGRIRAFPVKLTQNSPTSGWRVIQE